jgi:hypothetical protein
MKIKRKAGTTFCEHCGELKSLGRHAIAADLAAAIEKQKCPECATETMSACILGLGHYVYVCENCSHVWSNIDR